jgi:CTP-dependent riboflavin kinase
MESRETSGVSVRHRSTVRTVSDEPSVSVVRRRRHVTIEEDAPAVQRTVIKRGKKVAVTKKAKKPRKKVAVRSRGLVVHEEPSVRVRRRTVVHGYESEPSVSVRNRTISSERRSIGVSARTGVSTRTGI